MDDETFSDQPASPMDRPSEPITEGHGDER